MDLHYKQEVTVGTLVLVAIGLFIAGTMWLKGENLSRAREVQVQFNDVGNLKKGSLVTTSGVEQGKVERIELIEPGKVIVTLSLPVSVKPHNNASASVKSGLFSADAVLLFDPGSPDAPELADGQVIRGNLDVGISGFTGRASALTDRADSVLIGLQAIASQKTADEMHRTLQAIERTLNTMNQQIPGTTDEARQTLRTMRRLGERLDSTIAAIPVASAVARTDTLASKMAAMSEQLTKTGARMDSLLAGIDRGEGTLGKFATDTGLYNDMRSTLQSMKSLLDNLNRNPGKLVVQVKLF
jgi:phospholipid/cholesterol/gamma-HCH transport system substrate-binding protein